MKTRTLTIIFGITALIIATAAIFIGTRLGREEDVTPDDSSAAEACTSRPTLQVSVAGGNFTSGNTTALTDASVNARVNSSMDFIFTVFRGDGQVGRVCTQPGGMLGVFGPGCTNPIGFTFSDFYGESAIVRVEGVSNGQIVADCRSELRITRITPTPAPTPAAEEPTIVPTTTPIVTQLPQTGIFDDMSVKYLIVGTLFVLAGAGTYSVSRRKTRT